MLVKWARLVSSTPVSNAITGGAADENPSNFVYSAGSTGTPSMLVGRVPVGMSSRRPVSVVASSIS